jgi:hypothetical protein
VTGVLPVTRERPTPTTTSLALAPALLPAAVAAGLALLARGLGWRGSDLPAHFFRVAIVKRDGFEIWNNLWYGGHHTLGYGVLFPLLGAALGIWTITVLSAATSAFLADLLLRRATGRRCLLASMWFAVGTVTNVAVGRLPFSLGLAVALGALVVAQHRWMLLTAILTVATAAASPVVSAFLAIVFLAWAWSSAGRDRRRFVALAFLSMAPVLIVAAFYPQGGAFPFRWPALLLTLGVLAWVLVFVPVEQRLVRAAAVLYGAAAVIAFVVPTPLGANLNRFGMYAAGPALLAVVPMRRMLALVIPWLLFWQWSPSLDAMLRAGEDPSTQESYYRPLVGYLASAGAETGRLEIVPTGRHWEAGYVASRFPIARGWERQLDIRFNSLFYEEGLTAAEYHAWLLESGVDRVAVPDALLDDSGVEEAALIAAGLPYLREAWANGHWHVYEVIDATGLVDGPADVVSVDIDSVTLDVHEPGDVVVRVRESPFWVTEPVLCVEPTDDGWIVIRGAPVGRLVVRLDEAEPLAGDPCAAL